LKGHSKGYPYASIEKEDVQIQETAADVNQRLPLENDSTTTSYQSWKLPNQSKLKF
jgi:hypothetical protein